HSMTVGHDARSRARPPLLQAVIGSLLRDVDVVHVALLETRGRDAHELRVLAQIAERARAEVAHPGTETANQLLHDEGERSLVRDPALDALGHELHAEVLALVVLEVAVAAALALAHRLERAHAAIELVGTALVQDRLARTFLGPGEEAANHDGPSAGRQ